MIISSELSFLIQVHTALSKNTNALNFVVARTMTRSDQRRPNAYAVFLTALEGAGAWPKARVGREFVAMAREFSERTLVN